LVVGGTARSTDWYHWRSLHCSMDTAKSTGLCSGSLYRRCSARPGGHILSSQLQSSANPQPCRAESKWPVSARQKEDATAILLLVCPCHWSMCYSDHLYRGPDKKRRDRPNWCLCLCWSTSILYVGRRWLYRLCS